jgi:4-hydroxy-3-polyprenylbenzoate decarboxylase
LHDIAAFLGHILERADWTRDLHFQTETTIDTLDYSGSALNAGSKVIIAAVGPQRFDLAAELPGFLRLPDHFRNPRVVMPGVLAIEGPPCDPPKVATKSQSEIPGTLWKPQYITGFCESYDRDDLISRFRWIIIVDDTQFVAESLRNFLWVTFTRTNPAADIHGIDPFIENKHWGCRGPLVLDARLKPHHAPPLVEDAEVSRRVDALAAPGGPLHSII